MRRTNWIVAAICVTVLGTSVISADIAEAKGPWRAWHKKGKSAKSSKALGPVYAPYPMDAPAPIGDYPDVPMPVPMPVPETIPQALPLEDSSARANQIRERWTARMQRTMERQAQVRQERAERLQALAARPEQPTMRDRRSVEALPSSAIANTPTPAEPSGWRSWFDRTPETTAPQPAQPQRPVANRFAPLRQDTRRQAAGPTFPNEAPRFDAGR
jgi:hypothetical protein